MTTPQLQSASTPEPNALVWLWLSAGLIGLDQLSKWLVLTHLVYLQPVVVIDGFWNWTLVHNTGAAFSFLAQAGGWQRWLFAGLAGLVSGVLSVWLARTPRRDWRTALPFALVIAGGLGNLIDRLRFGYVIDFIDWYWRNWHWPAFNIADSCIVLGALSLVFFSFKAAAPAAKT